MRGRQPVLGAEHNKDGTSTDCSLTKLKLSLERSDVPAAGGHSCSQYELWVFKEAENFKLMPTYQIPGTGLQDEGEDEKGRQGQGGVEGKLPPEEED